MKKSELAISAMLVPLDYAVLIAAGLVTYKIRFSAFTGIRAVTEVIPLNVYLNVLLVVAAVWVAIFAVSGLYTIRSTRRAADELAKIFLACSTGILLVIVAIFFQRELFASRFVVLVGWFVAVVLVTIERAVVRVVQQAMFTRGIGVHRVVVVGTDETTQDIVSFLSTHLSLGYRIIDRIDGVTPDLFDRLVERMRTTRIDEIIQADPNVPKADTLKMIDFCNEHHIIFKYAADLFDTHSSNVEVQALAGVPIIEIKRTRLDGWGKILKRLFDVVVSVIGLIVTSPMLLIVGLSVKLDSAGPMVVKLERVGEGGNHFWLLKFRSMVKNAEALKQQLLDKNERDGPLFKMKNDPRITRLGHFLRRTSLDELPQLWNVVRGEMSLVGPRPHEPAEVARYEKHHRKLLSIKPGITGMAQTSGRSDLTFEEEVRLDTFYIENWSLKLDLQILLKTPWVVLTMRSAV
ncbi:MAG: sugar transferase [Candidatus Kerfeldbacteria bacterium]|nr:sugar transferase [Candidatus Kerfeldbacteria bacterium]